MATILESKDDFTNTVLTDNERRLIHKLRTLLLDLPDDIFRSLNTLVEQQRGERWTDQMLLVYLEQSLGYMNSIPLQTSYSLNNYPSAWESLLLLGAEVAALFAQAILQTGETFSYSDNGISLSLNLAPQYSSLAQNLQTEFKQQTAEMKKYANRSAGPAGVYGGMNSGVRLRSYSGRMWVYR